MPNPLLDAALAYATRGWHVFPVEPPTPGVRLSGKNPLTPRGFHDASVDPLQIALWWREFPTANIGIAAEPSGLQILDVDVGLDANGVPKKGPESLQELETAMGGLPVTLTAQTGSGGIHAIYLRGDFSARQALGIRPGLDLIGKGYFVAAPSRHYSGGEYSWVREIAPVQIPGWLSGLQRIAKETRDPTMASVVALPEKHARVFAAARLAEAWPASGRHMAFLALAGALATAGWGEDDIIDFTVSVARLMPATDEKAIADRTPQARDSVVKVARGETVAGWGSLSAFVDDAVLQDVQERLGLIAHDFDWVTDGARAALESALPLVEKPKSRWVGDLALIEYPPVVSYPTGVEELDALLGGGLSTQQVIAILGKPGAGKSALVISWALVLEGMIPVLYVTTELGTNEVVARLAAPFLGVAWRDIVRGKAFVDGKRVDAAMLARVLAGKRIGVIGQDEIYHAGEKALELIARTALELRGDGPAPVIFVDYMQELARGGENLKEQTSKVAVKFRQIAQALDCVVGLVSSINRKGYAADSLSLRQGDDPTAYMALAKESGDIDYAAATILFVDLDDVVDERGWRLGRIAMAKSRHGQVGFAGVKFRGSTGEWLADSAGLTALSQEQREARAAVKQDEVLEARIMDKLRELAMYGDEHALPKSDLCRAITGKDALIKSTLEKMELAGKVYETVITIPNPVTRISVTRKVVRLVPPGGITAPTREESVSIEQVMGIPARRPA